MSVVRTVCVHSLLGNPHHLTWIVYLTFFALIACGESKAISTPESAHDAGIPPLAIASPSLPVLTPCPSGWSEREVSGGIRGCMPWNDETLDECPMGTARFVGEATCAPVGDVCPATEFPIEDAGGHTLYVSANASPIGADGSRAHPFPEIADAAREASTGTSIVLARGTYHESPIFLREGVSLIGACAAETVIRGQWFEDDEIPSAPGVVTVIGPDVRILNLRIQGHSVGLRIETVGVSPASAAIDGLIIEDTAFVGLLVMDGSDVSVTNTVVRNTDAASTWHGGGIVISSNSRAELSRVDVRANATTGIGVYGGTAILRSASISDSRPSNDGRFGRGINVTDGRVELASVWTSDHHECGLGAYGGVVQAEDWVLVGKPSEEPTLRCGLFAAEESSVTIRRILVRDVRNHAIAMQDSQIELTDAVIVESHAQPDELETGWGLAAARATITATRVSIAHASASAVFLEASTATIRDLRVTSTRPHPSSGRGYGISVQQRTTLTLERALIERSIGAALVTFREGTIVNAQHVRIREVVPGSCEAPCSRPGLGSGVAAVNGATIELSRFEIEETTCGLHVVEGELDASLGRIANNEIGACILSPGFDVQRIRHEVTYEGTDQRNVDYGDRRIDEPSSIGAFLPES